MIARHLKFQTAEALTIMRKSTLLQGILSVVEKYEARGFRVQLIYTNNQFTCVKDNLMEQKNITPNAIASNKHKPYIERSNRKVKERL